MVSLNSSLTTIILSLSWANDACLLESALCLMQPILGITYNYTVGMWYPTCRPDRKINTCTALTNFSGTHSYNMTILVL